MFGPEDLTVLRHGIELRGGTLSSLRNNQIITARVIRRLENGSWQLSLGGKLFTARAEVALSPGQSIRARVLMSAGKVFLKAFTRPQDGLLSLLRRAGIPQDALSARIAQLLVRSGYPLDPARISTLRQHLAARRTLSDRSIRLAVLWHDRGLHLDEELLAAVENVLDGNAGGEDLSGGQREQQRQRREEDEGTGSNPAVEDRPDSSPPLFAGSGRKALALSIKAAVSRTVAEGWHPLHLFNHIVGKRGHWVIIPLSATATKSGDSADGTLRIYLPAGKPPYRKATLDVSVGNARLSASWENGPGGARALVIHALPGMKSENVDWIRTEAHHWFSHLHNLAESITVETDSYDGFSREDSGAIMRPIDEEA